jgi:hypothetical protein
MKRATALVLLSLSLPLLAQEFRATIAGRVTDATGAVLPGAPIAVVNIDTGATVQTVADKAGAYTVPFLLPGKYSIRVTVNGFQQYLHDGITLQSGAKIQEDVQLTVGSASEEIHVTADTALIETETATAGQVLTSREIEDLPDNGRSPLGLAKSMYGVVAKQKNSVVQSRPFDNSAASDFSLGGGNSQSNEYLLNGVPNMQDSSRLPGFSPLQDSVQELRVDVFEADASYGDTSGGSVNLITKAGTNDFHGAASEFNQFSAINAPNRWFASKTTKQQATRQNQYGGYISGPIWIPHVFNGRNKLFFLYSYEGFKGSQPVPTTTTVPTAAERTGDFSALLGIGTTVTGTRCKGVTTTYNSYQLFDPNSGVADPLCSGQVLRTPIARNVITNLSPVAQAYLNYFPQPNLPGNADGENNFYSNNPTQNNYNSHSGRIDYNLNDNNKFFFETHRSEYIATSGNVFGNLATGTRGYTVYQGGLFDYVHTFSPTTTIDTRISLTRSYKNASLPSQGFDATSAGFPSYINNPAAQSLPRIMFSESGTSFNTISSASPSQSAFDTIQLFSALTKVMGKHTVKIGPDIRANKNNASPTAPGSSNYNSGTFTFDNKFVSAGTALAGPLFGGSLASFVYGIPDGGTYTLSPLLTFNNYYFGGFIQDDWKVARHFTINMGIRLESETSINESHNRAVVGFDPTLTNSATAAATAAYAKSPIPELAASAFQPTGGLAFASNARRYEYATAPLYASPRVGFTYSPEIFHDKFVLRGGFGIFVSPYNDYYTPQSYGYISNTTLVPTTNNYLSPAASLSNPFPTANPILQPTGNSLGANTYLGQPITIRPNTVKVPYSERWDLDTQFQLTKNTMIDIGYIGNHQVHLSYSNCVSCAPLLPYLSRLPGHDTAVQNNLSGSVANPFKGVPGMTGALATATTIPKYVLLQAYPQYGNGTAQSGITEQLVPGSDGAYDALLFRFYKRVSNGLTLNVNYTYSHNLATAQLNPGGPLTYQETASDFPNHLSITGVYHLPFGRGQTFLSRSPRLMDELIGGFTLNTIYQYLSGAALSWSNIPLFANGTSYDNRLKINPRQYTGVLDKTLFDVAANDQPSTVYNYRTFPQFYGRQDATNNLDASILKDFYVGERFRLQYRFEAFNVLNHTSFGAPNVSPTSSTFGTITSVSSVPRVLQQGLRLAF